MLIGILILLSCKNCFEEVDNMIWATGIFMIVVGLAILFWGYALFRIWIAISGFLFGLQIGMYIGNTFFSGSGWPTILSLGLGLFFGIFAFALYKLGAVLIGFFLGGALSVVIFIAFQMEPTWWIFLIGAVPAAMLAAFFIEPFIKIASAFNGAYLIMIAIFSLINGKQAAMVVSGEVPWYFYIGLIILAFIGAGYQLRQYKGKELNPSISKPTGLVNRR
jgi:hypothetical protein